MKVIDAFWEVRNSGLTTCEILFGKDDTFNDYLSAGIEEKFKYSVAKIPSDNLTLLHKLEGIGYNYIETQFNICVATSEISQLHNKWNKVIANTDYVRVTKFDDLEIILSNLNDGMFDNDRISRDEKLGKRTSALRYINWIKDLFADANTEIFYLLKHEKKVGFFIVRNGLNNCIYSIIAGVFNKYQGMGYSIAIIYYYLKIAEAKNVRNVFTSFSSNNKPMLNTFTRTVSFKTLNVLYVLRRF
jgi:hypothetical protein